MVRRCDEGDKSGIVCGSELGPVGNPAAVTPYLVAILLSVGAGALYASLAEGLLLTYRGSGVINFSHGAIAMYGAYFYSQLRLTGQLLVPPLPNPFVIVQGVGRIFGAHVTGPHIPDLYLAWESSGHPGLAADKPRSGGRGRAVALPCRLPPSPPRTSAGRCGGVGWNYAHPANSRRIEIRLPARQRTGNSDQQDGDHLPPAHPGEPAHPGRSGRPFDGGPLGALPLHPIRLGDRGIR